MISTLTTPNGTSKNNRYEKNNPYMDIGSMWSLLPGTEPFCTDVVYQ
jgi:hypothetical protein